MESGASKKKVRRLTNGHGHTTYKKSFQTDLEATQAGKIVRWSPEGRPSDDGVLPVHPPPTVKGIDG